MKSPCDIVWWDRRLWRWLKTPGNQLQRLILCGEQIGAWHISSLKHRCLECLYQYQGAPGYVKGTIKITS